jgi:hypothetical protein
VTERDPVHRLPVEVGGIGVAGLFRDFTRARERGLGPAVDVVFDRLVRQRSWSRHLRARLVERLAFEPLLVGPVEQAAGFLEAACDRWHPVSAVVIVDDGRHGLPHSCVAGWKGLQSREERGGFRRLRCGGEDRLLVGFEDGQPGREILGMIRAGIVGDAEIGAEEGGSEFGPAPPSHRPGRRSVCRAAGCSGALAAHHARGTPSPPSPP